MPRPIHTATPKLLVIDPRGLKIRGVAYHRSQVDQAAEARITRHFFDAAARLTGQWDPRLVTLSNTANLATVYSLTAQPLLTESVDAGWHLRLHGCAGEARCEWDGRNTQRESTYDAMLRRVALTEQAQNASPCVTERLTYGDASPAFARLNQCTTLIRHDDSAGSRSYDGYSLLGQPLVQTQRFLSSLLMPDWPQATSEREALLERNEQGAVSYTTCWQYDALANVLSQTDAQRNIQFNHYDVAGQWVRSSLQPAAQSLPRPLLEQAVYNACGQVVEERFANGVITTATYSPWGGRLKNLRSMKGSNVLQNLTYTHDAIDNILSIEDAAQPTDWFNGEQVDPISRFVYDTLGQLIEATGRESVSAAIQPSLPGLVLPGGGDASRLRNYSQTFRYDNAGNVLNVKHGQWAQRTMKVDALSNRSLYQADADNPPDISTSFDSNGNLLRLQGTQTLHWDVRNQLQRATQVKREDSDNDDEVYVYGTGGHRQRKVRVQQARAVVHTAEVRYLPGLEIRTNTATGEVQHVSSIRAGSIDVRYLHWTARRKGLPLPQWRYALSDHLGSSTLELDEQADVISHEGYYPFGGTAWWAARSAVDATQKVIRYSNKERDATGLYYYGLRYYAPWLQRWINPDPLGPIDGLNLYAMVQNNPINHVDMLGGVKQPNEIAKAAAASILRDGASTALAATARYFATEGLNSLPVDAATITATSIAGGLAGGVAVGAMGFGLGARLVASTRLGTSTTARNLGGAVGGAIGFMVGATPSLIGYLSAMSSLATDQPVHNQQAIAQLGATLNSVIREPAQRVISGFGPNIGWTHRPHVRAIAGGAAFYGAALAGVGALAPSMPAQFNGIAGSVIGESLDALGGTVARGISNGTAYKPGTNTLTNPFSATERRGTFIGMTTRTALSAAVALPRLALTETSTAGGSALSRVPTMLSEARSLISSYMVEGLTQQDYMETGINLDPSTMSRSSSSVASNDEPGIAMGPLQNYQRRTF